MRAPVVAGFEHIEGIAVQGSNAILVPVFRGTRVTGIHDIPDEQQIPFRDLTVEMSPEAFWRFCVVVRQSAAGWGRPRGRFWLRSTPALAPPPWVSSIG